MKKTKTIIMIIMAFFFCNMNVNAAASLYTSASTVYKGNSFTTTVSLSKVAAWNVHVSATGPVSGCSMRKAGEDEDGENTSVKFSVTCKTTGTGSIKVTMSGDTTDENFNTVNISASKTVKVIEKPKTNTSNTTTNTTKKETKSSNNNLKRLEVEGFDLNPSFSPNTTEYTVNASHDVTKIKIHAWTEHEKGDLSGDGEKEVKEGNNTFEVSVKAENGSKKIYKINVIVDSKPINVEIDGNNYTMIKKSSDLPEISLEHEVIKLNIEDQEVEAYRVDSINYVLVGLRDAEGNINLYKFDSFKDDNIPYEYTLYQEINSNTVNLIPTTPKETLIPAGYKKEKIEINDKKIIAYKSSDNKYYLVYGRNIETGKESFYTYDKEEGTLQRYLETKEGLPLDTLKLMFIVSASVVSILIAIIIALLNKIRRQKQLIK